MIVTRKQRSGYHKPHKDSCDWQDWGLTLEALPPRNRTHKLIWINTSLVNPQSTWNQSSKPVQCYSTHQENKVKTFDLCSNWILQEEINVSNAHIYRLYILALSRFHTHSHYLSVFTTCNHHGLRARCRRPWRGTDLVCRGQAWQLQATQAHSRFPGARRRGLDNFRRRRHTPDFEGLADKGLATSGNAGTLQFQGLADGVQKSYFPPF